MIPSQPIDDSTTLTIPAGSQPAASKFAAAPGSARNGPANPVVQRDDYVLTPTRSPRIRGKPIAPIAFVRPPQARPAAKSP